MHIHETKDCIIFLDQMETSMQTRRKNYSYQSSVNKEMSIKVQLLKQFPNAEGTKYLLQGGLFLLSVTTLSSQLQIIT